VTLLAFLGAARMGGGFVTFTLIGTGGALATNLGLMLHLWLRLRWTTNLVKFYNSGEARALVRRGAIYATPQVSGAALTAALPTLLSSAGGPGAVTIYNLIQRLFGLVTQAHSVIVAPFWTAYAEAAARRDFRWIGQAFALLSIATLALFFPVLVLGTVQIGPLLRAWVPNAPPIPSQMFVVWVAVWCAAQMLGLVFQNLLLGLNRLHGLALFSTGGSVVAVFAMALLGHTHGATGVLAGLALGFGLVGVLGMGLQCIRVLRTGASL
jgi:O-antigen/teichoic acid export membrane protein